MQTISVAFVVGGEEEVATETKAELGAGLNGISVEDHPALAHMCV